jgi:ubiquitin-like-conjugating enzyme ATG3
LGRDAHRPRCAGRWSERHQLTAETQQETISDIPDITDSPPLPTKELANLNVKDDKGEIDEIPDIDDIPDMDDEGAGLEEDDDAAVKINHPSA